LSRFYALSTNYLQARAHKKEDVAGSPITALVNRKKAVVPNFFLPLGPVCSAPEFVLAVQYPNPSFLLSIPDQPARRARRSVQSPIWFWRCAAGEGNSLLFLRGQLRGPRKVTQLRLTGDVRLVIVQLIYGSGRTLALILLKNPHVLKNQQKL